MNAFLVQYLCRCCCCFDNFYLFFIGLLPTSILAVAFIAVLTAFPTKRSCQRNKDVRSLLRDALGLSNVVAQQSSVLSQEMVSDCSFLTPSLKGIFVIFAVIFFSCKHHE